MRFVRLLLGVACIVFSPWAFSQQVTITQLRDFLRTQQRSQHADSETADRLSSVSLSERLTGPELSRLVHETSPGQDAVEQLGFLADGSIFAAPPANAVPDSPVPAREQQEAMLAAGAEYAQTALQHLPDFLALRVTRRFDNRPLEWSTKHAKPRLRMHWVGEFKSQIMYRHGAEITENPAAPESSSTELVMHPGLISMGEFGPILALVFRDFKQGGIEWARWETDRVHGRLAVFHYTVPRSASHYLVAFCCYTTPEDETRELSFRDHPAYHGELILSPDSGSILRITIEADLEGSVPILTSQLSVQYGDVEIGGRDYLCPVQSIAMTTILNHKMARIDGRGIERHLNEVQYLDYHKFGSTSRIITGP